LTEALPPPAAPRDPGPILVPALLLLVTAGTLLTGALTPRDLSLGEDAPIWASGGDQPAFHLSRAVTAAALLASALVSARAILVRGFPRAGLGLWLGYLGFAASNFLLPGLAGREPGLDTRLLLPPIAFTAVYFARPVPPERLLGLAKGAMGAFVYAGLAAAVLLPSQALAAYLEGIIPGLPVRLYGVGGGATSLGALSSTYLAVELVTPSPSRWRPLHLLAAGTALVLTQAKTSWLFLLLVAGVLVARALWRRPGWLGLGGGPSARATHGLLLAGAAAALLALGAAAGGRFDVGSVQGGENLTTLTGRTYIWSTSVRAWLDDPVFGYGLGLWESERFRATWGPFDHAHNQLLHALASAGLVGLLGLLAYLGVAAAAAWRAARTSPAPLVLLTSIAFLCLSNVPLRAYYLLDAFALLHLLVFALLVNAEKLAAEAAGGPAPTAPPGLS
jgi:O-antigen ligase